MRILLRLTNKMSSPAQSASQKCVDKSGTPEQCTNDALPGKQLCETHYQDRIRGIPPPIITFSDGQTRTVPRCIYGAGTSQQCNGYAAPNEQGLCEVHARANRLMSTQYVLVQGNIQMQVVSTEFITNLTQERDSLQRRVVELQAELKEKADAHQRELDTLKSENAVLKDRSESQAKEISRLTKEIGALEERIREKDKEIAELNTKNEKLDGRVSELEIQLAIQKRERTIQETREKAMMTIVNVFTRIRNHFRDAWNKKYGTAVPNVFGDIPRNEAQAVDEFMGKGYSETIHYYARDIGKLTSERILNAHPQVPEKAEFEAMLEYLYPGDKRANQEFTELIYVPRNIPICRDENCEICNPQRGRPSNRTT